MSFVYISRVCKDTCVGVCARIFVCACGSRWLLSGTIPWYFLPYYLFVYLLIHFQTVHSLNLKLTDSVRLLASEFQRSSWAYLPRVGITVQDNTPNTSFFFSLLNMCAGDVKSVPSRSCSRHSLTKPSPTLFVSN